MAEIESHAQELFAELSDLRDSLEERPGDSSVRERIAQVGEEFRLLEEYGMGMVADNPTFQPEDMETVDLLRLQVRHAWPEVGEDFSAD